MRKQTDVIIINGYPVPAPDDGYTISESTFGDFERNSLNETIGQPVGRTLWKIENLQWSKLTVEQWKAIKQALKPFYVKVTFTNDENERITHTMYPSDRKSNPSKYTENGFEYVKSAKFNLVDCGLDD